MSVAVMADLEMEQAFLRRTLSPTIRRHQLRLPPIDTTRPTLQPEHPCCKNHHPHATMMAAEMLHREEQDFRRLTNSPTVLQHQRRLPPIKTRPSIPNPPVVSFVDELYEFPQPPSPSNPHIIISSSTTESAEGRCFKSTNPFCESPCVPHHHHQHQHPKAPAPTTQVLAGTSESFAAAAAGGDRIFEDRFCDLPAPIHWRLVKACKTAMRELVQEVVNEMKGSDAQTTTPEDVYMWRDVVAAAEVVGLDVDEPKRQLINAIRLL